MRQKFHSATIEHVWKSLHDPFSDGHKHKLPVTTYRDGDRSYLAFDSYSITGEQAGCVSSLLWKACQLDKQVTRQRRVIKKLQARLREAQGMIDCSIADLDPDL